MEAQKGKLLYNQQLTWVLDNLEFSKLLRADDDRRDAAGQLLCIRPLGEHPLGDLRQDRTCVPAAAFP